MDKIKKYAVWSPSGSDKSEFSYRLSGEISKIEHIVIAELPCLGIPRLGFTAQAIERNRNIEEEIMELEQKGSISLTRIVKKSDTLAILPVDTYAYPDYPVTQKVQMETLISFPSHLAQKAQEIGYESIMFDCQGQITTPMTYFAVEIADKVLIPVESIAEISFSLLNVKRLIQAFKFDLNKFIFITKVKCREAVQDIAIITDECGTKLGRINVLEENYSEITRVLSNNNWIEEKTANKRPLRINLSSLFRRNNKEADDRKFVKTQEKITL